MLIYEFRVLVPTTAKEYQVGQLYAVAKSSSQETKGDEGVTITTNEAFTKREVDGIVRDGQFTDKIYHLGSRLPGWLAAILPKKALELYERAWNCYPYCRTELTNEGFMGKDFYIHIITKHCDDQGTTENVHNLTPDELKIRQVKLIDIRNDELPEADKEFDCSKFTSTKTKRGPLPENWVKSTTPVFCAYKLVKCHFKWFGFQSKVENLIVQQQETLFRKFHRQVFCWIDEWIEMDMKAIREYEAKTKEDLAKKLKKDESAHSATS